jgi:hypothetical protein
MRIFRPLRHAVAAVAIALAAWLFPGALDSTAADNPTANAETSPDIAGRDLFNRAIYDVGGRFVGHVADVLYLPDDGDAYLLIAGVGSAPGGTPKDVALVPATLRSLVREHRRILVADISRESLQASAGVRFDAALSIWVAETVRTEPTP